MMYYYLAGAIVGLVAFVVGVLTGIIVLVRVFQRQITDLTSPIRRHLNNYFDMEDREECAKQAELFHKSSGCPRYCGLRIAQMFREGSKPTISAADQAEMN